MNRQDQRAIVQSLTAINPYTKIMVDRATGNLKISAKGGLNDEQRGIVFDHGQDILEFITTPPPGLGDCIGKHTVRWICSNYGVWICSCFYGGDYHLPCIVETKTLVNSSTKDAWINGTVNHLKPRTIKRQVSGF